MPNFPQQRDRLQPSKALFDTLPLPLADGVSSVLRRACINRTSTASLQILSHVRRHLEVAALGHKVRRVVPLIASHRDLFRASDLFQHHQRRVAFRRSVGLEHFCVND
jgi:hypothetical protein